MLSSGRNGAHQSVRGHAHDRVLNRNHSARARLVGGRAFAEGRKLDGKQWAEALRSEIRDAVNNRLSAGVPAPTLAVVLVGNRPDSETYVRMKQRACDECSIISVERRLPAESSQQTIEDTVTELASDVTIHGVLVQLPLPGHIDETRVLDSVGSQKDVDGFHPTNFGMLALNGRSPLFSPCTPSGCMELLRRETVQISGQSAVIMGRSNIVGLPLSLMLQQADATVSVLHSKTPDIIERTQNADIVVAAAGKPGMVTAEWLKPGAVVLDVGINAVDDSSKKRGYRLVGDVDYHSAITTASLITPVPGGIGPMTIATLLRNTLASAERTHPVDR